MHEIVHLLELRHPNDLEWSLNDTTTEKLDGLGRVLAVADVRAPDRDHLDDGLEDGRAQVGAGG